LLKSASYHRIRVPWGGRSSSAGPSLSRGWVDGGWLVGTFQRPAIVLGRGQNSVATASFHHLRWNPPVRPLMILIMSHISCWTPGIVTVATAAGRDGSSFVPRLPAWSRLAHLRSGEGAPSPFSSLLRRDEPGAPPPAAAEVAQASRSHFSRAITARISSPRCPAA
jgi:hypothetical protein